MDYIIYYDSQIESTHLEKHDVSQNEIIEFSEDKLFIITAYDLEDKIKISFLDL